MNIEHDRIASVAVGGDETLVFARADDGSSR